MNQDWTGAKGTFYNRHAVAWGVLLFHRCSVFKSVTQSGEGGEIEIKSERQIEMGGTNSPFCTSAKRGLSLEIILQISWTPDRKGELK